MDAPEEESFVASGVTFVVTYGGGSVKPGCRGCAIGCTVALAAYVLTAILVYLYTR
ncbi:hypothetical protein SAMN05216215_101870 [Saccharopolyspora shandongensis]|uniref:Uncharacterized protein n=1 Tax=Saccharopolyspora shandongensis TaxID=418495 RepID=A0A1H3G6Q4_9PSEU|nr:hypothetical protein SAMN05216215_101870 [Saccharopolyspora shandongensis]